MIDKVYMRYTCSEPNCKSGYKIVTEGMPRSKNGLFHPPKYGCPFCDEPLDLEISDSLISNETFKGRLYKVVRLLNKYGCGIYAYQLLRVYGVDHDTAQTLVLKLKD